MDTPTVSVVIPVFDMANFVTECVESVMAQTGVDWEIVVIDDGSTDGSGDICDGLAATSDRMTVCHTSNNGLSSARNKGVELARGRFVLFLDADDLLERGCLRELVQVTEEEDLDVLHFGVRTFRSASGDIGAPLFVDPALREATDGQDYFNRSVATRCHVTMAPMYLVRRSLLEDPELRFESGMLHEDLVYTTVLLSKARRMRYADIVAYHYRQWNGGITRAGFSRRHALSLLRAAEQCLSIGRRNPAIEASCRWKSRQVLLELIRRDLLWHAARRDVYWDLACSTREAKHWVKFPAIVGQDLFGKLQRTLRRRDGR